MLALPSVRHTSLILFIGCTALILIGMYMEHVMKLIPCPLCITQRVFIILVGLIGLIAFIHNTQNIGKTIYGALGALAAIIGSGFSIRQLYLQSLPADQAPACGPDVVYLLENFPLWDALSVLLRGDGNCSEVSWTMLGISIPGWTLVAFAGMIIVNLWQIWRKPSAV